MMIHMGFWVGISIVLAGTAAYVAAAWVNVKRHEKQTRLRPERETAQS